MRDTKTLFPDPERPFYSPDADMQRLVGERIDEAISRGGIRHKGWDGRTYPSSHKQHALGSARERTSVTQSDIADIWGVSQPSVSGRLNDPAKISRWEAEALCKLLGRQLDSIRYGDSQSYRYDDTSVISELYDMLEPREKEAICTVLASMVGSETVLRVRKDRAIEYLKGWEHAHKQAAFAPIQEPAQHFLEEQYGPNAWARIEAAANELEQEGVDPDTMTIDEILSRVKKS